MISDSGLLFLGHPLGLYEFNATMQRIYQPNTDHATIAYNRTHYMQNARITKIP